MAELTISLDEEIASRLRDLAQQRGESLEQTVKALITSNLPPESPRLSPDDPDGSKLILGMSGSLVWPGTEGTIVNTTNEEIDRLIAEEAMNPHDDERLKN